MATPDFLAAQLARCVERFRDPSSKEQQKVEFRALMTLLEVESLHFRDTGGGVSVNGSPVDGPQVISLAQRMALHGIAEIVVPRSPVPAEVFALIRVLAGQPGVDDVPPMLQQVGPGRVSVVMTPAPVPSQPGPSPISAPAPAAPAPPKPALTLGTEGILRGEPMTDIASPDVQVPGVPQVTHDPAPPTPESSLPAKGHVKPSGALPGGRQSSDSSPTGRQPPSSSPHPIQPSPAPPAVPPAEARPAVLAGEQTSLSGYVPAGAATRTQPTDTLLGELERAPESANVGDLVAGLGRQVEEAVGANRFERALTIIVALVRLEQRVPEGSARRNYGIALRRMYTKPLLKGLAGLLSAPRHQADAVVALQRGGADAVEVLLEQLITATAVNERRGIFDALRQANAGREQLIPFLRHEKWYVIRNIAELIGEMGMQTAVPELAACIEHPDERVRKAVALALAKIGSPNTGEPLRRALKDKSPEVRIQVAVGVGGRRTTGLSMPLIVALKEEEDETVQREMILALGRIGTPDAVQALIKVAQPSGILFGRKPASLRIAAVEALRLAGTAPAVGTLEGLGGDGDKQVRTAAQAAVWELTKKKNKP